jgi:DNA-binding transcriptional regulator GbsR (MarR family)
MITKNYTKIPNEFIFNMSDLSGAAVKLYIELLQHVNEDRDDNLVWPGYSEIQKHTGLSRGSISKAIKELNGLWIKDTKRRFNDSTKYFLSDKKLTVVQKLDSLENELVQKLDYSSSENELLEVQKIDSSSLKTRLPVVQKLDANNTNITRLNNNTNINNTNLTTENSDFESVSSEENEEEEDIPVIENIEDIETEPEADPKIKLDNIKKHQAKELTQFILTNWKKDEMEKDFDIKKVKPTVISFSNKLIGSGNQQLIDWFKEMFVSKYNASKTSWEYLYAFENTHLQGY